MRVGIGLLTIAFLVFLGGQSYAQTFPALPGMGAVENVTHSQAPQTTKSVSAPVATSHSVTTNSAPNVTSSTKPAITAPDLGPILKMPGAASLPIIKDYRTDARTKTATPDLLALLAGIGTATSLGMLWALRKRA